VRESSTTVWEGRKRLISSHMLLILQRAAIGNNIRFGIRARDHGGGPNDGANPGVERGRI